MSVEVVYSGVRWIHIARRKTGWDKVGISVGEHLIYVIGIWNKIYSDTYLSISTIAYFRFPECTCMRYISPYLHRSS